MPEYLTIGELARQQGLSRSTLLYYDRLGLLRPVNRSEGNYRLYSPAEAARLEQICLYRRMGVPLKEVVVLLEQVDSESPRAAQILAGRLRSLEEEVTRLQEQQRQIIRLLASMNCAPSVRHRGQTARKAQPHAGSSGLPSIPVLEEADMVNKERWVAIMKAAGLTDDDMRNWHRQFEKMEPEAHQEFLQSLDIGSEEIESIREWSRT
jgi:DNA-binding transcriptional MerR regulator